METLKKVGVCAGAALGGAVGGAVSLAGKVIDQPEIDRLGEVIVDSAILTGEITGHALSGAADVVAGVVSRDRRTVKRGSRDLKKAGGAVVKNAAANVSILLSQAGNVAVGVKTGDKARVMRGLKTMGKMAAVQFFTVGAVQMDGLDDTAEGRRRIPPVKVVKILPQAPATARVFPTAEEMRAHGAGRFASQSPRKKGFWSRLFH